MNDLDLDLARMVDLCVDDAAVEVGMPASWLEKQGSPLLRPLQITANIKPPRWTAAEDRILQESLSTLTMAQIGEKLGRTATAVKIRMTRKGFTAARYDPGYLSTNKIAAVLGVDSHAPPCWVDVGILRGEPFPYPGRLCRRVRIYDFQAWLIRPENWVYFKAERIGNPHLRRLVTLAQQRWNDEWWSTRQAADYHHCDPTDILRCVKLGRLQGLHAVSKDRRRTQAWAYCYVRRSEVLTLNVPRYKGSGRVSVMSDAAKAFLLRARVKRWSFAAISKMMKIPPATLEFRYKELIRTGAKMKHTFTIAQEQEEMVAKLAEAMAPFTGGKVEIITIKQLVTEDERMATALELLIGVHPNDNGSHNDAARKHGEKVWTVAATGEKLTIWGLNKRLAKGLLAEGVELTHVDNGACVVARNSRGKLVAEQKARA